MMEYIDGSELLDEVQRRLSLSENMSARIMKQLLSCVMYCHEKRIMHRDIKPENIMVDNISPIKSSVSVIDFGFAQSFSPDKAKEHLQVVGTPNYMAPEVQTANYDEKCDIWSCGVTLYVMLSGDQPFAGATKEDLMQAVRNGKFAFDSPKWRYISEDAKDLVRRMVNAAPAERITAREAYAHPWTAKKREEELPPPSAGTVKEALRNLERYVTAVKMCMTRG